MCGTVKIEDNKLIIKNIVNHISGKGDEKYNLALYKEYLKRIMVAKMMIFKRYGDASDASNTAIVCGIEEIVSRLFEKYVRTKNKTSQLSNFVMPCFCDDENNTTVYAVLKISIMGVIISVIKAKLSKRKGEQKA